MIDIMIILSRLFKQTINLFQVVLQTCLLCLQHVYGLDTDHLEVGIWVGWLVCLSVSTQISKQAITLPNHIPACRSEFPLKYHIIPLPHVS